MEKKFQTRQILNEKFQKASDFGLKNIQRIRFWIEKFWTCQVFEKKFASKKSRFGSFYSVKTTYFAFLVLFLKSIFLNWKFQHASDFDLRDLQRVRFENKKKILKVVLNLSFFHVKKIQHVRFSIKKFTTIERQIEVWQLPVVHLATKTTTDIVVYFSSSKYVVINVDRRNLHSVKTWKTW